jgi:competence protein ComEA
MKRTNRAVSELPMSTSWWGRARARWAASPWVSLLPKGLGLGVGLGVLALIGAGAPIPWVLGASATPQLASVVALPELHFDAGTTPTESPDAGESAAPAPTPAPAPAPAPVLADGRVVLNLAGEAELVKLPGIGPKRAQRILEARARLGRFRRVEDLLRVKGIGRKALAKIAPLVVLDPPPAPAASAP